MRSAVARWEPAVVMTAGCALLLVRPLFAIIPVAGYYTVLGAAALLAPQWGKRECRLHPAVGLAFGLGVVSLAPAVAGFAPPIRAAGAVAIGLNMFTSVVEEAFFRRMMYGWLEGSGAAVAVGATALIFAAVHVPIYGMAAFPVDLGAGLLFGWQRWATGSWGVPAATHVWANLVSVLR